MELYPSSIPFYSDSTFHAHRFDSLTRDPLPLEEHTLANIDERVHTEDTRRTIPAALPRCVPVGLVGLALSYSLPSTGEDSQIYLNYSWDVLEQMRWCQLTGGRYLKLGRVPSATARSACSVSS